MSSAQKINIYLHRKAILCLSFTDETGIKHQKVQRNRAILTKSSPRVSSFTRADFRVHHAQAHQRTRLPNRWPCPALGSLRHRNEPKAPGGPGGTDSGRGRGRAASPRSGRRPPGLPAQHLGQQPPRQRSPATPGRARPRPPRPRPAFPEERTKTPSCTLGLGLGLFGFFFNFPCWNILRF